jgi:uncharacterized membrane protein YcjF (UPF0283 family)
MTFATEKQRRGFFARITQGASKIQRNIEQNKQTKAKRQFAEQQRQLREQEVKLQQELAQRQVEVERIKAVEEEKQKVNKLKQDIAQLKKVQFEHSRLGQALQGVVTTYNRAETAYKSSQKKGKKTNPQLKKLGRFFGL